MLSKAVAASRWPLGPIPVVAPAVTILAVVVAGTWPMVGWPYPLWVQTSAQFHQQFTWAGLIAGTSACWYATTLQSKNRALHPDAPAMTGHLTVLSGWLVGAYLLGLLPLVISTMATGGIGTPDPLAMLSGVLAMAAAVTLGYALGTVVASPVMVPIVAVGFYALLVAGIAEGKRYATVAPVLYLEPELGQHESLPLLMFRIALFVAITAAAVSLTGKSVSSLRSWRRVTGIAIPFAVPGLLIVISLIRQPVVFTTDSQPAATCTERHEIRYCVHPDNQPRLAELIRTVDPMIVRFGTTPANLDQVWDYALTFHPIDTDLAHGLEIAWLNPDGTLQTRVSDTIAGVQACATSASQDRLSEGRRAQVADDVSDYLATGTPSGTLAAMSVTDVQQWIAQHQQQVHNCALTPDQLPEAQTR